MKSMGCLTALLLATSLLPQVCLAQRVAGTVEHTTREIKALLDPDGDRLATFLAGGGWHKRRSPGQEDQPGQNVDDAPTPHGWFRHWRETLLAGLQPARLHAFAPTHPLLTMQPTVIVHASGISQASALPWSRLACPDDDAGQPLALTGETAGRLGVNVQALQVSDDGKHLLGVDIWCRLPKRGVLRRFVRLLVHTDDQGRVKSATGVVFDRPLALGTLSDDAVVEPPFAPALNGPRDPPWLVSTPSGWVAQVRIARRATSNRLDSLPTVEPYDSDESRPTERALWWLDAQARPRHLLLDRATPGPGPRQPLPRLGPWDEPLGDQETLILQAVGVPQVLDDSVQWTETGLVAWRVRPDTAAEPVTVPLPRLKREGVWGCTPQGQDRRLRCVFQGPELPGLTPVADVELRWLPGRGLVAFDTGVP